MSSIFGHDSDPGATARQFVRRAVHDIVRDTDGPDAFTTRPIFPGASSTESAPDPAAAFKAARIVRDAAENAVRRYVAEMREGGRSWDEIGELLPIENGDVAAAEAFEQFADGDAFDRRFFWRCLSCEQTISDRGPYNGHPVDCETGHAEDCARHAAEVEQYERFLNEG